MNPNAKGNKGTGKGTGDGESAEATLTLVAQFRGHFPQVPTYPDVDVEALHEGDDDPFYVTLPVSRVGAVSRGARRIRHDEALLTAIAEQLPNVIGGRGHLSPADKGFPLAEVVWVGHQREGATLWAKGYIPPGNGRDDIKRRRAARKGLSTSIYGDGVHHYHEDTGDYTLNPFKMKYLDLGPPHATALDLGGQFEVTRQFTEESAMDRNDVIASLTVADLDALPTALVAEMRSRISGEQEAGEEVAQLTSERDQALELVEAWRNRYLGAMVTTTVAQMTDWPVQEDSHKAMLAQFRQQFTAMLQDQLGTLDVPTEENVQQLATEVWDANFKLVAETLRHALSGGSTRVSGQKQKTGEDPRAAMLARGKELAAEFGFGQGD
jgi:hypothetical protein